MKKKKFEIVDVRPHLTDSQILQKLDRTLETKSSKTILWRRTLSATKRKTIHHTASWAYPQQTRKTNLERFQTV